MAAGIAGKSGRVTNEVQQEVRGDLLSCLGTALAGLLRSLGIPYLAVMGGQLFTGVRKQGDLLEFLHYHTPLDGDGRLYRIGLHRAAAGDAVKGATEITVEARRAGAVVVTGSNVYLPWLAGATTPAPHWYITRPVRDSPEELYVDDRFTWVDDDGEHLGFAGRISKDDLQRVARASPPATPEIASRERWATGRPMSSGPVDKGASWQWITVQSVNIGDASEIELLRIMLTRSAAGEIVDTSVAAHGWAVGDGFFELLRRRIEEGLDQVATYANHNDLWVAARNREAFREALQLAAQLNVARADGLHQWVSDSLVPAWYAFVRAMRMNQIRLERGMPAKHAVVDQVMKLSALESEARSRLAEVI